MNDMTKCNSRLYIDLDIILKTGIGQSITGRWGKRFETTFSCVKRRKGLVEISAVQRSVALVCEKISEHYDCSFPSTC